MTDNNVIDEAAIRAAYEDDAVVEEILVRGELIEALPTITNYPVTYKTLVNHIVESRRGANAQTADSLKSGLQEVWEQLPEDLKPGVAFAILVIDGHLKQMQGEN